MDAQWDTLGECVKESELLEDCEFVTLSDAVAQPLRDMDSVVLLLLLREALNEGVVDAVREYRSDKVVVEQ